MSAPVPIFISYSHDSDVHQQQVVSLATRLVEHGIDVELDVWVDSPPEGWPHWMERRIRTAQFVVVVCTEIYNRRARGDETAGKGLGVRWESLLTYQYLYDAGSENHRFVPVVFQAAARDHIPTPLRAATYYDLSEEAGFMQLYRRLSARPELVKPPLGQRLELTPRNQPPPRSEAVGSQAWPLRAGAVYSQSSVRAFVMQVLIGDPELEAFCADHQPAIKRMFTNGMDRLSKVTLLLERVEPAELLRQLRESQPERASRYKSLLKP